MSTVSAIYRLTAVSLVIAALLACSRQEPAERSVPNETPYGLQMLKFQRQNDGGTFRAVADSFEFVLRDPDDPEKPTAWEGPLEIRELPAGRACRAQMSLVTEVYVDGELNTSLVRSYSGSISFVDFVDVRTCAQQWPQLAVFTERITVSGDRLIVSPGCEAATPQRSLCSAGQVLKLQRDRAPVLLDVESRKLTKDVVGVEFVGQAWVESPKTAHAKLVTP